MSRSPRVKRQPRGAVSSENAPQVVVRAGKHYVCSDCGVLVEIPADVVGEWVLVAADAAPEETPDERASAESASADSFSTEHSPKGRASAESISTERSTEEPTSEPAMVAEEPMEKQDASGRSATASAANGCRPLPDGASQSMRDAALPARSRRPKRPRRPSLTGQMIDGLPVPTAGQLDRAFQWVSYQLNVLDRQDSEIKRLKKLLKARPCASSPCPRPRGQGKDAAQKRGASSSEPRSESLRGTPYRAPVRHAHQDVSMAPAGDAAQERGPP